MNIVQAEALLSVISDVGAIKNGVFYLSHGEVSRRYYDFRQVILHPRGGPMAGNYLAHQAHYQGATRVVGPSISGIALAALTIGASIQLTRCPPLGAFVRINGPSPHGLMQVLEGASVAEQDVMLVDDVVSSGMALEETARIVQVMGGNVVGVVTLLERFRARERMQEREHLSRFLAAGRMMSLLKETAQGTLVSS